MGYFYGDGKRSYLSGALTEKEEAAVLSKLFSQTAEPAMEVEDPYWRVRYQDGVWE